MSSLECSFVLGMVVHISLFLLGKTKTVNHFKSTVNLLADTMAVVLSQPAIVSSQHAAATSMEAAPPIFAHARYTGAPVANENPISLPVYLRDVQLREAGTSEMTMGPTASSSDFQRDDLVKRTRRGRRGGRKQHQSANVASSGAVQRTIKKHARRRARAGAARPRAPPPPPRNTNAYLMAAAAARSKAEHGEWQESPTSVVASPLRSCASTCYGGGAVPALL